MKPKSEVLSTYDLIKDWLDVHGKGQGPIIQLVHKPELQAVFVQFASGASITIGVHSLMKAKYDTPYKEPATPDTAVPFIQVEVDVQDSDP